MSPTAARIAAVPFGLLTFAGIPAVKLWITPLSFKLPFVLSAMVYCGSLALAVTVPFAGYLLVTRRLRPRPASLQVDTRRTRFVVPARPGYPASMVIMVMSLAGNLIMIERVPDTDRMRLIRDPHLVAVSMAVVGPMLVVTMLLLFFNRPRLILDPAGLTSQWLGSSVRIGWDGLAPGGPPPPVEREPRFFWSYQTLLRVYLNVPPTQGWYYRWKDLPVGRLQADPAFLAWTIRHYVEQPWHRPAIGTEAELTRLRSVLAPHPVATPGPV